MCWPTIIVNSIHSPPPHKFYLFISLSFFSASSSLARIFLFPLCVYLFRLLVSYFLFISSKCLLPPLGVMRHCVAPLVTIVTLALRILLSCNSISVNGRSIPIDLGFHFKGKKQEMKGWIIMICLVRFLCSKF